MNLTLKGMLFLKAKSSNGVIFGLETLTQLIIEGEI